MIQGSHPLTPPLSILWLEAKWFCVRGSLVFVSDDNEVQRPLSRKRPKRLNLHFSLLLGVITPVSLCTRLELMMTIC